jgi:ribosomal protein S18 acetylase RimI-like enzyme
MNVSPEKVSYASFEISQTTELLDYLWKLSGESKKRFGPHAFTAEEIARLHHNPDYLLFVANERGKETIIAYTILKKGWVSFDASRLESYGLKSQRDDYTMAPSVADAWQCKGIGSNMFHYISKEISLSSGPSRVFLWGGVQDTNDRAKVFYQKLGFVTLGEFEHNGKNLDMFLIQQ